MRPVPFRLMFAMSCLVLMSSAASQAAPRGGGFVGAVAPRSHPGLVFGNRGRPHVGFHRGHWPGRHGRLCGTGGPRCAGSYWPGVFGGWYGAPYGPAYGIGLAHAPPSPGLPAAVGIRPPPVLPPVIHRIVRREDPRRGRVRRRVVLESEDPYVASYARPRIVRVNPYR